MAFSTPLSEIIEVVLRPEKVLVQMVNQEGSFPMPARANFSFFFKILCTCAAGAEKVSKQFPKHNLVKHSKAH